MGNHYVLGKMVGFFPCLFFVAMWGGYYCFHLNDDETNISDVQVTSQVLKRQSVSELVFRVKTVVPHISSEVIMELW